VDPIELRRRVRVLLIFFIVALVVSGLTAFPLVWESTVLHNLFGAGSRIESSLPGFSNWIDRVHLGLVETDAHNPFILYALIVPLALICGSVRGIPPFWRFIDCSFGIFGIIPLWLARRDVLHLARLV
jgi:hypothetical protein